ncbi:Calcium-dependent lipid-binding (CaLB domain) family protein [Rhynchospora pubera]|uniref:Calcium-dependent lipid-binding (CaLB domain) family protein n=1 Tax=Rhynchospora pubera TaxID=906938 RepID=A0AAV8FQJ1_9POAL|nr:Calcium-dependent lipid-binding (CaLB domain) family protein [Rhynchospora pubera]
MATASPPPPQPPTTASSRSYDLEITVISAKHLKNVNWRHGDLKPYAVAYLHPDRRSATKPDDSGSTRPVWNERLSLSLPVPFSPHDPSLLLTLDIFHSKPSETPKPLVGSTRIPLKDLIDPDDFLSSHSSSPIKTIELCRPSGRPQGKVRIKLSIRERPAPPPPPPPPEQNYQFPPPPTNFYYSVPPPIRSYSPPPPPTPQHVMPYSSAIPPPRPSQYSYPSYSDHYSGYYSTPPYYSAPPAGVPPPGPVPVPAPVRPYYDRPAGYGGPSAPVDYAPRQSAYDNRTNSGKFGVGTGLAVGAVAGAFGAMALEEGVKYEEEKIAGKVESDLVTRDNYNRTRWGQRGLIDCSFLCSVAGMSQLQRLHGPEKPSRFTFF